MNFYIVPMMTNIEYNVKFATNFVLKDIKKIILNHELTQLNSLKDKIHLFLIPLR